MDDGEIIERCLEGDPEPFEALVRKYQAPLLAFCANILGDIEEARDISQESFLAAYRKLDSFDRGRDFRNWLYAIAAHKCIDRKRRLGIFFRKVVGLYGAGSWPRAGLSSRNASRIRPDKAPASPESWPERKLGAAPRGPEFDGLFGCLSPKERTALVLSAIDGCSAAEAARIMSCAENTVRVHIFRARVKLRKHKENADALRTI